MNKRQIVVATIVFARMADDLAFPGLCAWSVRAFQPTLNLPD